MRRLAAIAASALLLAACGSTHAAPAKQRSDVRVTVTGLLRDLAAGNGAAVCARLTTAGRSSLIKAVGPELSNFGITSCEQVVHITGMQLSAQLRSELRHAAVGVVAVHGSRATVRWADVTSPQGDLGAFFGHPPALQLVAANGAWLVSSL